MNDVYDEKGNIITGGGQAGDDRLFSVPIDELYTGLVVPDNVYDSTGDILLITGGNTLDSTQIERIKRLNRGSTTINVTRRTRAAIEAEKPSSQYGKISDLENSIGYTAYLAQIYQLFQDAAKNRKVNRPLFTDIAQSLAECIKTTPPDEIITLVNAVTPKDEFLHRHILNVGMLNGLLGHWLGLSQAQINKLILTGLLHDLGNALMPHEILFAARDFTILDYEVIKMHPFRTGELLLDFPDDIRLPAVSHHERLDGSGYPMGSIGSEVYGATRITTISDIYEAIVSMRPHRGPRSPFFALATLTGLAHRETDTSITSVFCENLPKQLLNKPVKMSNGTIGIIRGFDADDIEYPEVEVGGRTVQTGKNLFCVSMYSEP